MRVFKCKTPVYEESILTCTNYMQMSPAPTTLPEQKQELPSLVYSSHNSLQLCEGTLNLQTHNLGKA